MAGTSVSIPNDDFIKMRNMGIKPSWATQLGLSIIFKYGGKDAFETKIKEMESLKKDNSDLFTLNEELNDKIKEIREELDFARKELFKKDPKNRLLEHKAEDKKDVAGNITQELKDSEVKQ